MASSSGSVNNNGNSSEVSTVESLIHGFREMAYGNAEIAQTSAKVKRRLSPVRATLSKPITVTEKFSYDVVEMSMFIFVCFCSFKH